MSESSKASSELVLVPDEEIGQVASLITRAFRGISWHTEEELVSDFTLTEDQLRKQIANINPPGGLLQLKDEQGNRIGCILLRPLDEEKHTKWRFAWFAIEPTLQTGGMGKKLLAYTEQYAKQRGAKVMELNAMNVRRNLIGWYERRGYKLTGESEPFVHNQDRHGELQRRDLSFLVLDKVLPE